MREVNRLLDQLTRAYDGEAWHGPALREVLSGVTARQAAARPVPEAHTIWELVLHIAAWENAARKALAGEPISLSEAENFPAIPDPSEAAWRETLAALETGHHCLRKAVAGLSDDDLETILLPSRTYSIYFLLQGIVQHNLYHTGQIVLLKKALKA